MEGELHMAAWNIPFWGTYDPKYCIALPAPTPMSTQS